MGVYPSGGSKEPAISWQHRPRWDHKGCARATSPTFRNQEQEIEHWACPARRRWYRGQPRKRRRPRQRKQRTSEKAPPRSVVARPPLPVAMAAAKPPTLVPQYAGATGVARKAVYEDGTTHGSPFQAKMTREQAPTAGDCSDGQARREVLLKGAQLTPPMPWLGTPKPRRQVRLKEAQWTPPQPPQGGPKAGREVRLMGTQ